MNRVAMNIDDAFSKSNLYQTPHVHLDMPKNHTIIPQVFYKAPRTIRRALARYIQSLSTQELQAMIPEHDQPVYKQDISTLYKFFPAFRRNFIMGFILYLGSEGWLVAFHATHGTEDLFGLAQVAGVSGGSEGASRWFGVTINPYWHDVQLDYFESTSRYMAIDSPFTGKSVGNLAPYLSKMSDMWHGNRQDYVF